MKSNTVIDMKQKMDEGDTFTLLDVREVHEVAFSKINPHKNIPMSIIPIHHEELDKKTPIIVMCHSGARSAQVCLYLESLGYDVTNLEGGIDAWSRLVDPTVPRY
jgi:rhodanese-related sulfurtransferase